MQTNYGSLILHSSNSQNFIAPILNRNRGLWNQTVLDSSSSSAVTSSAAVLNTMSLELCLLTSYVNWFVVGWMVTPKGCVCVVISEPVSITSYGKRCKESFLRGAAYTVLSRQTLNPMAGVFIRGRQRKIWDRPEKKTQTHKGEGQPWLERE